MINQKLSFGQFTTSAVKRGWDFTGTMQYNRFSLDPKTMLLRVLNIDTDTRNLKQRNKFQYSVMDGKLEAEVFATEKFSENQLVYKSNNPFIGNVNATSRYEYAFTAAILPLTTKNNDPWSLVLMNKYDAKKDTARSIFNRPYIEEEGYATNGKENITIRPLRLEKLATKNGKETKVVGGPILTGYELRWDEGVVAIIDILDNSIWFTNNLDEKDMIILSSISSAILLKRMQDVEKDKDFNF